MVKRVILGRTGEEKIVDLIKAIDDKVSAGHTRPAGTKVLDEDEDFVWSRPDGTEHSVRDIDEELQGARDAIEEAQVEFERADRELAEAKDRLEVMETETLPAAVQALEEADAEAQQVLGQLDGKLATAQQDLVAVGENIGQLEADLATESDAREQLAQEVQGTFSELDTRLGEFATDEALAPIRQALTDAQDAVETAQGVAQAANQAANAASQAALEAAGIAASKGRVIIQETEPVGEDRNAANIWIKPIPDDPNTEIEEKAITYVYLEGSNEWVPTSSDELAQAAQNALDAREAAQQAQQRADTAIANAAAAQSAAEAAQRTADTATTDAREAWNKAIAAQDRADELRADLAKGPSVWEDPSFERGMGVLPGPYSGRIELSSDWAASGSQSVKYIASGSGGNNYGAYFWVPVTAGRWYAVSATVHAADFEQQWTTTMQAMTEFGGESVGYLISGTDSLLTPGPGETISRTWFFQIPEGSTRLRAWAGQVSTYNKAEHEGQVVYLDDFRMVDVTESYPQYLAAQQAADAAQGRADEAMAEASEAKGLAEEAVREVGDTVRNTVIEYAVNTSETIAPTSGWSTSTPTRTPGSFVWMRTIVTYADGDTSTTSPALLTGNAGAKGDKGATGAKGDKGDRGADGVPGKDGVGLSGTALAYAMSTSGTTAPSSGWTAAPPTPIKGRYLWTRTIWTYTDSSTETGYSVAYLATDGAKGNDGVAGKDGVGIKSTAITYAASSSGTTAPSSGWAAQPPAASAGQYVWTRTIWTYTDNTTETGYSVGKIGNTGAKGATGATGAKGDKGDTGSTGAQGVSVSSVDPFFRTVSRTAGAPARPSGMTPSGWSTTEPAWSPNTKLYRAERVVYSSGTVSWTVPTLVAAYEGIVQVQTSVNGKNSITRSTSNASGSGVVAGDAWYKVDGNGDTMAMWIWSGSAWVASKVRNEMIDTIDVNKLKVHGTATMDSAVIDKLWVDGLAARAVTAGSVTVAPGNLLSWPTHRRGVDSFNPSPHRKYGSGASDIRWSWDADMGDMLDVTMTPDTSGFFMQLCSEMKSSVVSAYGGQPFPVKGGNDYRLEMSLGAGGSYPDGHPKLGASFYWYSYDGTSLGVSSGSIVNAEGNQRLLYSNLERSGVTLKAPDGAAYANIFLSTNAASGHVYIVDPELRPLVGAVQISDGAVSADKVNAESVAGAVGEFVEAEVGNLKATKGTIGEAVINKVWADGIAAKTATFSRVTVASGNLLPDFREAVAAQTFTELGYWTNFGINQGDPSFWVKGNDRSARYIEYEFPMEKGVRYSFEVQVRATVRGSMFYWQLYDNATGAYIRLTDPDGLASATYPFAGVTTSDQSSFVTTYRSSGVSDTTTSRAKLRIYPNHTSGADNSAGHMWFTGARIRPMTGATLIEPGAITTEKLTVTGDMSAEIVNAMTTTTKKLLVTEELVATAVNIPGKMLVGKDRATSVFTGKVAFENIEVTGEVLADKILADKGLVAGGPDGQVVIDGAGITRYETDSDGQQIETFRLGPQGGDIATFGDTTISPTGIGSPEGSFDQLTVGGESLETILAALPRGMRAWGALGADSKYDSDTTKYARRAELQTSLLPDRLYRVRLSSHYLDVSGSVNATVVEELRYSLDMDYITTGSNPDGGRKEYTGVKFRQHVHSGNVRAVPGMEFFYDTADWTGERQFWVMFMIRPEQSERPVRVMARHDYPTILSVEDMGPSQAGLLKRWNDGTGTGSQDTAPTTKRYTKTYTSTGHNTYDSDGSPSSPKPADVVQGLYGGGPSRLRRRGGWSFPSFTSDLSGATVEKIEAYVYMNHSYYAAGADVNIATHNGTLSNLTSRVAVKGWKRNTGKWVTLPSSLYNGFKNGTYKGVGVISTNATAQQYARFNGSGAKIRITYVK